jgi:hypothetical protein
VTFPSKDFQSPKSSTLGVITGSFVKPFTPVAKKRYATIKTKKYEKNYIFFIILRILFKVKNAQASTLL